ncbi:MAG: hypothetical protein ACOCRO_06550 [Halanaerobiales bacterium]
MFYIQDPTYGNTILLHEALLNACEEAKYGAGVYAFVTASGVSLFLEDNLFKEFISDGCFKLIIGIDEITNTKALDKLNELIDIYNGKLKVLAFLHNTKNSIFHPKFSWFKKESGGILVLGSGNLTEKGLRRNREAFIYIEVDQARIEEIEEYWNNWLLHNNEHLKSIENDEVRERVKVNEVRYQNDKRRRKEEQADNQQNAEVEESIDENEQIEEVIIESEDIEVWSYDDENEVLVAQIPRSKNRWKQANFDKDSFEHFFDAIIGDSNSRLLLRNITNNGEMEEIEVRPGVTVKSHNWRIELGAATRKDYPDSDRPTGIFIKVATRMFLYVLAMPEDSYYNEVKDLLDEKVTHNKPIKRYRTNVEEIKNECPNLPIWEVDID